MRLDERIKTRRGYERTRFILDRPASWEEMLRLAAALVTRSTVESFALSVSPGEIGAGGHSARNADELAVLLDRAAGMGSGDIEGRFVVDGTRVDFFCGDSQTVTFLAKSDAGVPLAAMLMSAERTALS